MSNELADFPDSKYIAKHVSTCYSFLSFSPSKVKFFNLPTLSSHQILASPLVHSDVLSLLRGTGKDDTKALRLKVSTAISKGEGLSLRVGIRQPSRKWSLVKKDEKDVVVVWTRMILTPLLDRNNSSFAMIALFG